MRSALSILLLSAAIQTAVAQTLTIDSRPAGYPASAPLTLGVTLPYRYSTTTCKMLLSFSPNTYGLSNCSIGLVNSSACRSFLNLDGRWYPLGADVAVYEGLTEMRFMTGGPPRTCSSSGVALPRIEDYRFTSAPQGAALLALGSYILGIRPGSSIRIEPIGATGTNEVAVFVTSETGNVVCTNPVGMPGVPMFRNGFE